MTIDKIEVTGNKRIDFLTYSLAKKIKEQLEISQKIRNLKGFEDEFLESFNSAGINLLGNYQDSSSNNIRGVVDKTQAQIKQFMLDATKDIRVQRVELTKSHSDIWSELLEIANDLEKHGINPGILTFVVKPFNGDLTMLERELTDQEIKNIASFNDELTKVIPAIAHQMPNCGTMINVSPSSSNLKEIEKVLLDVSSNHSNGLVIGKSLFPKVNVELKDVITDFQGSGIKVPLFLSEIAKDKLDLDKNVSASAAKESLDYFIEENESDFEHLYKKKYEKTSALTYIDDFVADF